MFNDTTGMRKTKKSAVYDMFHPIDLEENLPRSNNVYVIGFDKFIRHSDSKKRISKCQKRGFSVDFNTNDEEPVPFGDRKKIVEIKFATLIAQIPFSNVLALSYDNASVITGKYESLKIKLQKHCKSLIMMPRPCHASALVANAACSAIPKASEELLRKVASFTCSSSKRVCIFEQFQKSFCFDETCRKILKLKHDGFPRHTCVARLNENSDVLLKFLQEEQLSEKSKPGAALLSLKQNSEILAYLLFLEYILDAFNKFNASFQTEETKVHLLQSAGENRLKTVLKNVIKAPLLNFVSMGTINPSLACNRLSPDLVMVGEACQDVLDRLYQEGQGEIVKSVYDNCLAFYEIAEKGIRNKLFVKDEFLSKWRIFEPKFALQQEDEKNSPNNSVQDIIFVAQRFGGFHDVKRRTAISKKEFHIREQKATIINLDFDEAWKTIMATKKADGKFRYPVLNKLVNTIQSLPNSNADAERVFSMLTDVKTKERNKLHPSNVQSLCVFKLILRARGETARTMIVDARYLTLISKNVYKTNARENSCFLLLFDADEHPSTSSDL
ncbi:hypothetical protein ALC57_09864 [Trachymyrmex cornetzi]|uniref:HAT C-terminal dimerisation domain-containing protein n=1 Tax=Trachymyrmex cornetzi TaxID=471704 RepID=A0A151J4Y8_9HYME|nr:hypothetical protein ALC57_09864 [Trachymyrmex cornetzi]